MSKRKTKHVVDTEQWSLAQRRLWQHVRVGGRVYTASRQAKQDGHTYVSILAHQDDEFVDLTPEVGRLLGLVYREGSKEIRLEPQNDGSYEETIAEVVHTLDDYLFAHAGEDRPRLSWKPFKEW